MLKTLTFGAAVMATLAMTGGADAAPVYFATASGYVSSIVGTSGGTYSSDGEFALNSPFSAMLSLDTSGLVSNINTVNGAGSAVYTAPLTYNVTIGTFQLSGTVNAPDLLVLNNYSLSPSASVDGIGFAAFLPASNSSPITFGNSAVHESFEFGGYDSTGNTLGNVDISGLNRLMFFPNVFAQFVFVNSTFDNAVTVKFDLATSSLRGTVLALPEPAAWAMLVVGFAATGHSLRRRQAIRT